MSDEQEKSFDLFELLTAILLGLAAIGAALAGLQGGQWGGKQLEAFSEANTLTTRAASQYNEDMALVNSDYATVARAKEHILEARDAKDEADRQRHFELASYFYMYQLNEKAYKAMKLPIDYYVEDEEAAKAPGAPAVQPAVAAENPAAAPAAEAEEEEEEDEPAAAADPAKPQLENLPNETLLASLSAELDDEYIDSMLENGEKMFQDADKRFAEGRAANDNGDKFDLAGLYFTVALFFAGVGLVFKTGVRWLFFTLGFLIFAGSSVFMARLPWAG
jgi:hypothetical protein